MGDRGNIIIEPNGSTFTAPLYMYTHWRGSGIQQILQSALKRGKGRWNDPSYLARIIFNELTKGCEMEETGFGLSNSLGDNEHPLLWVDMKTRKVRRTEECGSPLSEWGFEEFIALKIKDEE